MSARPVLGLTCGDPAGIGPEIVRACLSDPALPQTCEFRVVGCDSSDNSGHPSAASARAAWDSMKEAAGLLQSGEIQGIVTGPVCKQSLHKIGFPFPGQTEFFAARAGADNYAMCLTGGSLTVALVTIHVPLRDVARLLRTEEVVRVGQLLQDFARKRLGREPRIAVAGLNPHAGEGGDFGEEDEKIIAPAVGKLAAHGNFSGPWAPDTIFHRAVRGEFDAVLCMYHDQGLIPLKLLAFDTGVNVTLGLPFVRTSPDHGTAFEIAGTGKASHTSMMAAIKLAAELL
ncbi:MAG: 4-hydroxythreonine-4-phosphate dehydrogenase PdxA [Chthoniobacterales bacterium]|nr:4-hydroxythreonine-4-phosphate dehydrogenase PdxA [Chthoniobacterales bacterium]